MSFRRKRLTTDLVTPTCKAEFSNDWARRILVDYIKKNDPDWLLADVLKVHNVGVKDNPHPGESSLDIFKIFKITHDFSIEGMLSDSYVVNVLYSQNENDQIVESWFVKVPKSTKTFLLDEIEVFMYDQMFPLLQAFASKACENENEIQMPLPLMFHCAYDEFNTSKNVLVMENLRDQGYKPLRPETCGLVFMRAAMTRSVCLS